MRASALGVLVAFLAPLTAAAAAGAAPQVAAATAQLAAADRESDPYRVAAALDVLRAAGPQEEAAEVVAGLLSYRHPLYHDRDKLLVIRLRAYAFATLADLGPPPSALPALIDVLVHADEQSPVIELAAAARAAAALGPRGRFLVPYLLQAIPYRRSDERFSLERFSPELPAAEATSVQLEAVRALAALASPEDREAVALLADLAADEHGFYDHRLVAEAAVAVARIEERR